MFRSDSFRVGEVQTPLLSRAVAALMTPMAATFIQDFIMNTYQAHERQEDHDDSKSTASSGGTVGVRFALATSRRL